MNKPILYVVGTIFLAAVAIQAYPLFVTSEVTKTDDLDNLISRDLPGWSSQELPLGETEEVRNTVERRLNFDDYFSRVYRSGETQVGVYIAYWEPGKTAVRMVGAHTPDTCWVQNGWVCTDRESNVQKEVGNTDLKPGEFGIYEIRDNVQHVLFWHLVGDRVYGYEQEDSHNRFATLHDMINFGLNQRQEQYFIRISSNRPFSEIWDDAGFQQLMQDIGNLGLKFDGEDVDDHTI